MKTLALSVIVLSVTALLACNSGKPAETHSCKCKVKIESTWCGPAEEQKAKIEALERDPLACNGATGTVVDLDATYVVMGCARD